MKIREPLDRAIDSSPVRVELGDRTDLEVGIARCTELGFPPQRLGRIGEHLHNFAQTPQTVPRTGAPP